MGTEFVASHVWRKVNAIDLASRIPLLNTFVPNLVWLPSQVAKLSGIEGGIVQQTLQAMSRENSGTARVDEHLRPVVEEAWDLLPPPAAVVQNVDPDRLNWFVSTRPISRNEKWSPVGCPPSAQDARIGRPA